MNVDSTNIYTVFILLVLPPSKKLFRIIIVIKPISFRSFRDIKSPVNKNKLFIPLPKK